jgi:amino acid transporter
MKKLLKLNPQYPISIGLIIMGVGGIFFDATSDVGLLITLLGGFIMLGGAIIGLIQIKKIGWVNWVFIICSIIVAICLIYIASMK